MAVPPIQVTAPDTLARRPQHTPAEPAPTPRTPPRAPHRDPGRRAPRPDPGPRAPHQDHAPHRALRRVLPAVLALLLAAPLLAAAHRVRPAPYGDHLTVHARVEHDRRPALRRTGITIEAYDQATGRPLWAYARKGRHPLDVLHARGDAIALWDDGLVTATATATATEPGGGSAARWHRALPGAAPWLAAHGRAGVLRSLGPRILAVVTPRRIAAYRIADGDLRWVLPARLGCAFAPARAVRHHRALLIAQPCAATDNWTDEIIAVDDLGRITPDRTPLGNERHSAEHPHTGKVVARPR